MMTWRGACWAVLSVVSAGCGELATSTGDVVAGGETERGGEIVTIDFSVPGEGPLSPTFFEDQGVLFPDDSFVGFVQGDEALATAVEGRFLRPVSTISVRLAPALQGTATYTLSAFSASGAQVGTISATVTQDIGDPYSGPEGYFDLTLTVPSRRAKSFSVENDFVRSSFPEVTSIPFAASTITFTRQAVRPL